MLARALVGALVGALFLVVAGAPVVAERDPLQEQRREGDKICYAGPWQFRPSGAWPTRPEAMEAVAKSWARFTAAEYGPAWAALDLAADVAYDCAKGQISRGEGWSCNLTARPCRRGQL